MNPLLAAFGIDPAWASPANFILLICFLHLGSYFNRTVVDTNRRVRAIMAHFKIEDETKKATPR